MTCVYPCLLILVISYMAVYISGLALDAMVYSVGALIWMYGSLRVARAIHQELVDAVLGTTLRYVFSNPYRPILTLAVKVAGQDAPGPNR